MSDEASIIARYNKHYGTAWNRDAPPNAKPLILEGRLNITRPNPTGNPKVILVIEDKAPKQGAGPARIVNRVQTEFVEYRTDDQYYEVNPFAEAGRLSWMIRVNQTPFKQISQFRRNDGFAGAGTPTVNMNGRVEGISNACRLDLTYSPIVALPGQNLDLILIKHFDQAGDEPPIERTRVFWAIMLGYSLAMPPP